MKCIVKKNRNLLLIVFDIIIVVLGYILSLIFLDVKDLNVMLLAKEIVIYIVIYELYLNIFRLYQNMLEYEVGNDYIKYIFSSMFSIISIYIIGLIIDSPYLSFKIDVLAGVFISGMMIIYRLFLRSIVNNNSIFFITSRKSSTNLLIIGAGMSAREIIITINNSMKSKYNIVGLIDDDISKINHMILGVKVLGTRNDIQRIVEEKDVNLIFLAINHISPMDRKNILNICQETNVKTRVLPTTEAIIDQKGALNSLRDVEIEDLLGRNTIELKNNDISGTIKGKTVLVTGGGGSIGSELCRQIAKYRPGKLIIFDIYENNLYDIEMELRSDYPKLQLEAIVGSVRDINRLNNVFSTYKPNIVFHAAAHKHVPLMENSPLEAIKNNIFGTYNVVNCSDKYSVDKFVLISTDKAVNPTNVMGASKRVCEMIVQAKDKISKTNFVSVRFGNVLGSNGSVIPLFKKQIANGGPVTVTHKEITRFFMTIPEAVQLILQALTCAEGGEIFVLDMGEPVKIYDLAVSLIKLMGYDPDVDMPIKITGLRPGEKLYEELLMSEEGLTSTKHDKIFISKPSDFSVEQLDKNLDRLKKLEYDNKYSSEKVIDMMRKIVPTYRDSKLVNSERSKEMYKNEKRN